MKMNKPHQYRSNIRPTTNYEGGEAFELQPKSRLLQMTATCLFREPKFYGTIDEHEQLLIDTAKEVAKEDPVFILKLAKYLRTELHLRTIPIWLLVFIANQRIKNHDMTKHITQYTPQIIQRADEITETMAMQLQIYGKPIPNSIKNGLRNSFKNFDVYQFAKYQRKNSKGIVTFKDVIMLTHPKEPSEIIKQILDKSLPTPVTWEVMISKHGNKKEIWELLIDKNKLPYMATLRNLRNLLNADISIQHIKKVADFISNPANVRHSKQFPFRFFTAYREIQSSSNPHTSILLDALESAIKVSYENIPHLPGTTLIACDVSGSMETPISRHSSLERFDIGLLLGAMAFRFTDYAIVGIFGDTWKPINLSHHSGIIKDVLYMHEREGEVGYSTNGHLVIDWAINKKMHIDRFMFFSDNQFWNSTGIIHNNLLSYSDSGTAYKSFLKYRNKINPDAKLYIFDLAGYGTTSFPEEDPNVIGISGWSDRIFDLIQLVEKGMSNQVKHIESNY